MSLPRNFSIRHRLLLWTAAPLLVLVLVNAWASYRATLETAQTAYDRLLITAAHALADMIWLEGGTLQVSLPHTALELYATEVPDRARLSAERSPLLYRISDLNGELLAGDAAIAPYHGPIPAPIGDAARLQLYDTQLEAHTMRMVALWQPVESAEGLQYVVVQVGEHADYRYAIGHRILKQTLLHQALLLGVVLLVLWGAATIVLRPLRQLAQKLENRSAQDLNRLEITQPPREIRPLLNAFNGLLARMQQAQQRQQRFVADASHQLRTPLAVLQLQADAGLHGDIPMREALQDIANTTRRTSRAVHQLLMWDRAQHIPCADHERLDLRNLCQDVVLEQSPLLAQKHLDFTLQAQPTPWQGQAWMVQEVLMNLLSNAIRHTPAHHALGLRLEPLSDHVRLTVWDTGSGLSAHIQSSLFTPFVSEGSQGVGLGLTISRDLAHACGGSLTISNRIVDGQVQGVDATLLLPVTAPWQAQGHPPQPSDAAPVYARGNGNG